MTDETHIVLGGKPYCLRADFHVLSAIEQDTKAGLLALSRRLVAGMLTLEEVAAILEHATEAPIEDIRAALMEGRLASILTSLGEFFTRLFAHEEKSSESRTV